jgi:demethoxyubiquinone hydroxylase (CLK1/Coq7/Cat5 family)
MSLIERLEKRAKYHASKIWQGHTYYIHHEDERRLLQEAADHIKGLSLLADGQKQARVA